jgi:hypothetical protein
MKHTGIPLFLGELILDPTPRQAFRMNVEEIIYSIKQQFSHWSLCFREPGQNSADNGCGTVEVEEFFQDRLSMFCYDPAALEIITMAPEPRIKK